MLVNGAQGHSQSYHRFARSSPHKYTTADGGGVTCVIEVADVASLGVIDDTCTSPTGRRMVSTVSDLVSILIPFMVGTEDQIILTCAF